MRAKSARTIGGRHCAGAALGPRVFNALRAYWHRDGPSHGTPPKPVNATASECARTKGRTLAYVVALGPRAFSAQCTPKHLLVGIRLERP